MQKEKRLFLGIPLPQKEILAIQTFRAPYQDLAGMRWVALQNLHITAYFFGNVAHEQIDNLISLIHLSLQHFPSFELLFSSYCFAPRPSNPRMIWAQYHKHEQFKKLVGNINQLYQQIQANQNNRKNPSPHITLARLKNFQQHEAIDFEQNPLPQSLRVKELRLWQSRLSPSGAVYEVIKTFKVDEK